jgi:hypothetical protein
LRPLRELFYATVATKPLRSQSFFTTVPVQLSNPVSKIIGCCYNFPEIKSPELTTTHDITKYTKARIFSEIGKKTDLFARFSTVAGERGAADTERDIRGLAVKFYTEEGNWDLVGNNTPVFFLRDPLKFPDLNHAVKRDPRTSLRSALNN